MEIVWFMRETCFLPLELGLLQKASNVNQNECWKEHSRALRELGYMGTNLRAGVQGIPT